MTPSFKYTRHKEEWHWAIFLPLLMRHGPPPRGVKWYGKQERVHLTTQEAKTWNARVVADCKAAVEESSIMSHYAPKWRENHALHVKNNFLEWCKDERNKELRDAKNPATGKHAAAESAAH